MIEWFKKEYNELSKDELYEILRLRSEVFVVEQNCIYQDIDQKDKKCIHLFAMDEDIVVAALRIIPEGIAYDVPAIGRVVVKEEYRRNGYARKMLLWAIDIIKTELKADKIKLAGQAYLKEFYISLGFAVMSPEFLDDGIPHYEFELNMKQLNMN